MLPTAANARRLAAMFAPFCHLVEWQFDHRSSDGWFLPELPKRNVFQTVLHMFAKLLGLAALSKQHPAHQSSPHQSRISSSEYESNDRGRSAVPHRSAIRVETGGHEIEPKRSLPALIGGQQLCHSPRSQVAIATSKLPSLDKGFRHLK